MWKTLKDVCFTEATTAPWWIQGAVPPKGTPGVMNGALTRALGTNDRDVRLDFVRWLLDRQDLESTKGLDWASVRAILTVAYGPYQPGRKTELIPEFIEMAQEWKRECFRREPLPGQIPMFPEEITNE